MNEPTASIVLNGIDGANPLGFLAALGTAITARAFCQELRFSWQPDGGVWRPALHGCGTDQEFFLEHLFETLKAASMRPFEIDKKLPFETERFKQSLREAQYEAEPTNRRVTDFLVAFGSEVASEKGIFKDTRFRMVRSGDSAGQGLPAYAMAIRGATDRSALNRSLFHPWDYADTGFALRWDPIEDQRYALRWRDPSKSTSKDGPGSMTGANSLAIEALQWYPTVLRQTRLNTTGFRRTRTKEVWFAWPIWVHPISLDTVRSLLALSDLHNDPLPRTDLSKRGIVEVYRSQRIQQNQYY
ncbi:MAG TPA: hypothetical protein VJX67_04590, partial [Blastocatellia bacterium]|nr:hypothetical protein [Blastocatellia bacterium]